MVNLKYTPAGKSCVAVLANSNGGVNDHDVAVDLVAIVPEYEPHSHVNVCVKLETFLSAVIV